MKTTPPVLRYEETVRVRALKWVLQVLKDTINCYHIEGVVFTHKPEVSSPARTSKLQLKPECLRPEKHCTRLP